MALYDGAVLMEKGGMDRESEREREKSKAQEGLSR